MEFDYKLHSRIGIKCQEVPSLKLWYFCRAYDQTGAGKLVVELSKVQTEVSVSRTTVWRYLKDKRLFRSYKLDKGVLTIYYSSIKHVCKELDVKYLGAIGNVDTVHDMYDNSILITALWLQNLSCTLAKKENTLSGPAKKKKGGPNVKTRYKYYNDILKYFSPEGNPLTSYMCRGVMVGSHEQNTTGLLGVVRVFETEQGVTTFILSEKVLPYGASYKGIAKALRITEKAVGDSLREIPRVRTILRPTNHYQAKAMFLATEDLLGQNPTNGYYLDHKGRVLKWHTNLYYPSIALSSQAQLRGKLHKYLSRKGVNLEMEGIESECPTCTY